MYRRLPIRLLCLALLTFFTLPAGAQYTRDTAATKKIDQAINEHYLATDFDRAESVLTGTITACAEKCSPAVLGKAWMYVGIVRGSGKNDQNGAKEAFQKALAADPAVKLDTQLATPDTQKTFSESSASQPAAPAPSTAAAAAPAAAREDAAGDKGGVKCTPDVREMQTRRALQTECHSDEEVASMDLRYLPFGEQTWKSIKMTKIGENFRGEVPCDATGFAGVLKFYVRAKDAAGETVDSFGSKGKPIDVTVSETSDAPPPAFPGGEAPGRCVAKEECPPDFPGCQDKSKQRGNKDWGVACDNSMECKEGLLCTDGTCETAPSCESNSDCESGSCFDNKCSVGEQTGAGPSATYKKNWFGLHFAQDIAIIGGSDVCSTSSRRDNGYACYLRDSSDNPYNSEPYPGTGISTGFVVATRRIMLSFDRALTRNITLGARAGFAFSGGPPAGKNPAAGDDGTSFLPFHGELRLAYWFGKGVLGRKGLRPYAHVGGGVAQVDAKVKVLVAECNGGCFGAQPTPNGTQTALDAWRKMGQSFVTAGGGLVYAFKPNFGAQLNVNLMYMFPTSGPVIQPSLGVIYGL